jgi:hypothetical protein
MGPIGPEALLEVLGWGTLKARWPNGKLCAVSADGGLNEPERGVIFFKDFCWYVCLGFEREEGSWHHSDRQLNTAIQIGGDRRDLAPSYRKRLIEAALTAVASFTDAHPDVITEAERARLLMEQGRARKSLVNAEEQLGAATEDLINIDAALAALPPEKEIS